MILIAVKHKPRLKISHSSFLGIKSEAVSRFNIQHLPIAALTSRPQLGLPAAPDFSQGKKGKRMIALSLHQHTNSIIS